MSTLISTTLILGGIPAFAGTNTSKPSAKKIAIPQPVLSGMKAAYNKNEKIEVSIFSTDYSGSVKYRVFLDRVGGKDIINITKGYSSAIKASAVYKVNIPELYTEGKYKLVVYAKASTSKKEYDSTDSKVFSINKDIILSKKGQVLDLANMNKQISGNIYIKANKITIKNVKLKGAIIVSANKISSLVIANTEMVRMDIKANGIKSLQLSNVKIGNVNILKGGSDVIEFTANNNTQIAYMGIASKVKFQINNKSRILKFYDNKGNSNLAYKSDDKDKSITSVVIADDNITPGAPVELVQDGDKPVEKDKDKTPTDTSKTTESAIVTTTVAAITTATAITSNTPPDTTKTTTPPPDTTKTPPQTPPATTAKTPNPPTIEFAGMLLSNSNTPVAFTGSGYSYSLDLSTLAENTWVIKLCVTVSQNAKLTINGFDFNLTAHVRRDISVLKDFGLVDNPPEGASLTSIRALFGSAITFSGELSNGVDSPVKVNISVKVK